VSIGVIFDLDGVLADTHPIHIEAWRQLLFEENRTTKEEDLDFVLEGRRRDEILEHFFGAIAKEQKVRCAARKDELFRKRITQIKALPGVHQLLDRLEECRVPKAVGTSGSRRSAFLILHQLKLLGRFKGVVTGDDVEKGKPDPQIFASAARYLGSSCISKVVVFEDSVAGVQAAKGAGMQCVGIGACTRALQLYSAGADLVVEGLPHFLWPEMLSSLRFT